MLKLVTLDQDKLFSSRMGWEGLTGEYFSGSLMLMDFDDHRLQRRLMQTAFKAKSICEVTLIVLTPLSERQ